MQWTVVATEVEALQLEYNWIKEFDPRFNVRYRDDKTYPVLAVTMNEEFPRLHVYRGPRRKGVRYFGPYAHAWAIRETLDLLLRVFPARTCSAGVFKRHGQIGRPCLLGYIDKCSAPCVGRVTADEHRDIVEDFCDFLAGRTDQMMRQLERRMAEASGGAGVRAGRPAARRHRRAAPGDGEARPWCSATAPTPTWWRSPRTSWRPRCRSSTCAAAGSAASAAGWSTRSSPPTPRSWWSGSSPSSTASRPRWPTRPTTRTSRCRGRSWCPSCPPRLDALAEWLCGLRGSRVQIRVPQRGDKRALAETVARNAAEAFTQHKLRRAGRPDRPLGRAAGDPGRARAGLARRCASSASTSRHVQGTNVVASLVVFEDGLARKSEYRRFEIRDGAAGGDVAAIAEVVRRRFRRYLAETRRGRCAGR